MWWTFWGFGKDKCTKTREMLSAYIDQRLNPEEMAGVEEHLRTCRGCREEKESLRATVVLLHRLPEVTPSKSFAVSPVRPLPGRRALPTLRFATTAAALLLVLAFAADWTGLFEGGMLSNPQFGPSALDFGSDVTSQEEESYWVVPGVRNSVDPDTQTVVNSTVRLVVPDGSDNVVVAVKSLALSNGGVLYGNVLSSTGVVPQVVLEEDAEGASVNAGSVQALRFVSDNADEHAYFYDYKSDSGNGVYTLNGSVLDMVPVGTDNNALYSFNLDDARREVKPAGDDDWLRALEYGLIGLVGILGGAAATLWLRQRRQRAA